MQFCLDLKRSVAENVRIMHILIGELYNYMHTNKIELNFCLSVRAGNTKNITFNWRHSVVIHSKPFSLCWECIHCSDKCSACWPMDIQRADLSSFIIINAFHSPLTPPCHLSLFVCSTSNFARTHTLKITPAQKWFISIKLKISKSIYFILLIFIYQLE